MNMLRFCDDVDDFKDGDILNLHLYLGNLKHELTITQKKVDVFDIKIETACRKINVKEITNVEVLNLKG